MYETITIQTPRAPFTEPEYTFYHHTQSRKLYLPIAALANAVGQGRHKVRHWGTSVPATLATYIFETQDKRAGPLKCITFPRLRKRIMEPGTWGWPKHKRVAFIHELEQLIKSYWQQSRAGRQSPEMSVPSRKRVRDSSADDNDSSDSDDDNNSNEQSDASFESESSSSPLLSPQPPTSKAKHGTFRASLAQCVADLRVQSYIDTDEWKARKKQLEQEYVETHGPRIVKEIRQAAMQRISA